MRRQNQLYSTVLCTNPFPSRLDPNPLQVHIAEYGQTYYTKVHTRRSINNHILARFRDRLYPQPQIPVQILQQGLEETPTATRRRGTGHDCAKQRSASLFNTRPSHHRSSPMLLPSL